MRALDRVVAPRGARTLAPHRSRFVRGAAPRDAASSARETRSSDAWSAAVTLREALEGDALRGAGVFAIDEGEGTRVVRIGGASGSARDELAVFAASTSRDAEALRVAFRALPRRSRSGAVREAIREAIEALGYVPEENGAVAVAPSVRFERRHLEALERDGVTVVDGAMDGERFLRAAASARALHERGFTHNLRQSGRDDDVAVLLADKLPSGSDFAGLRPCVDLLLGVPDALRRALQNDGVGISADVRSKIERCSPPDRLMVARYGPNDARYVAHLDNDPSDALNDAGTPGLRPCDRVFTCIAYLNPDWIPEHRGEFRAHALGASVADERFVDIAPVLGRVVVFDSAKLLHEVRPSAADRYAVTVWTKYADV